jgi:hypothetical protein
MSRFTIVFLSHATQQKMAFAQATDAAAALRLGREAEGEGLRHVQIVDTATQKTWTLASFAQDHRV